MNRDQRSNGGPIGTLAKGAGFLIGLGTELHAHNKAKKSSNQSYKQKESPKPTAQDEVYAETGDSSTTYEATTFKLFQDRRSPSVNMTCIEKSFTLCPLPHPVILPQRRPNDKSRGFLRAYAPDLGTYKGIEESTFLDFLKDLHKSSQASPIFTVINIAAMGASFAPSVIAMAVATSVQIASKAAAEAQSRYCTNAFLDKANEELFHPKNLHCIIMTFKPEASGNAVLSFGLNKESSTVVPVTPSQSEDAASRSNTNRGKMSGGRFRTSNGVTEGEFMLPEAAHLIFPTPVSSETSSETNESDLPLEKTESSWKSTGKVLADYRDRRAQAKFAATYGQDSKLAVPGATESTRFASKFSDPNANPLEFMSGLRQERSRPGGLIRSIGGDSNDRTSGGGSREMVSIPGLIGGVKRMIMQQNVLYLLIAEIPSEEEMRTMLG